MPLWVWLGTGKRRSPFWDEVPPWHLTFITTTPSPPPGLECRQAAKRVMQYLFAKYLNIFTYKRGSVATKPALFLPDIVWEPSNPVVQRRGVGWGWL